MERRDAIRRAGALSLPAKAPALAWRGAWYAEPRVYSAQPLDLRPCLGGTLELDLQAARPDGPQRT